MLPNKTMIAVTGGNGLIGRHVVNQLLAQGFRVRSLARQRVGEPEPGLEIVIGDLRDRRALQALVHDAGYVVHCAGEIHDPSKMREINTNATALLMQVAIDANVKGFCHISSAGVVGTPNVLDIDETVNCAPSDIYEESKWLAEQELLGRVQGTGLELWILRPTNVIDSKKLGVLGPILQDGLKPMILFWLKGDERAHIIHAADVAAAAIHVMTSHAAQPGIYFVGCDEDDKNRFRDLRKMYDRFLARPGLLGSFCLPSFLSCMLRKLRKGRSLRPDSRFLSTKLLATGFSFPLGVDGAIKEIATEDFAKSP